MSSSADMQQDPEVYFTAQLVKLAKDVLETPVPVRHLLVAAPGSGKTTAAITLAKEIAKANSNHRILIIGPQVVAAMYERHLARAIRVTVVSRRLLREWEAIAKEGQPIWPAPLSALMSMDTARQDDVRDLLCSVTWDLVVLEEVHLFARSRWTLLKTILSERTFQRVLLITGTPDLKGVASLLKNVARTDWIASDATRSPKINTVAYRRSDDEVSLLRSVLSLTRKLSLTPVGQMVKRTLLRQAASSPLALERTVRHLRNTLAHGVSEMLLTQGAKSSIEQGSEGLDTDADMAEYSTPARSPWKSKPRALEALGGLLEQLESVDRDTKREALEGLLQRLGQDVRSNMRHIWVLCFSRATANYLQTVVAERGTKAWLLTGDITPKQFNKVSDGFKSNGGVLISTVSALRGIDLRYVQVFIHYDPPVSDADMVMRVTRSPGAINYILTDKSGVMPAEWSEEDPPASASRE